VQLSQNDSANRPIYLGVNKSVVVDLPQPAGDVLVSNPRIADAVLRTSSRLYLIGVSLGQASVFLFDDAGAQIASFDIYVEADLTSLNQLLAEAIPDGYVRADAVNGSIVLRGQVASSSDAARAQEIAESMIPAFVTQVTSGAGTGNNAGATSSFTSTQFDPDTGPQIVNLLNILGEEQVALKVTIAEVQREVVKQLGINISGVLNSGDFSFGTVNGGISPIPFPPAGGFNFGFDDGDDAISATLEALEETSMIRTLAEPTLTAVTGETADFLAGGEFPFRVCEEADDGDFTCSIEFKRFGVQLAFTPVVLGSGRISLKLRTEVSEISDLLDGVPVLAARRAETTVELPSGGAFVVAGLITENTRRAINGFPLLQNLPILGALFSSKDFLNRETELVMIVTPYAVKPASPNELTRPDENLFIASDAEAYFFNRLTKVYGKGVELPGGAVSGQVGFTFD
jgi:pilus assembly protein CpaC